MSNHRRIGGFFMASTRGWPLLLALVLLATSAIASGPYSVETIFVSDIGRNPAEPTAFFEGRLDVIQRGLDAKFYVAAWRALMAKPFSKTQAQALLIKPCCDDDEIAQAMDKWLGKRSTIKSKDSPRIEPAYWYTRGEYHLAIVICGADAFRTATQKLDDLIGRFGYGDPWVRHWLDGQDIVFDACGAGTKEPSVVDNAPLWLAKERAYQIAATRFYKGDFEQAVAGFRDIAADEASPWRDVAAYLVARSLYRAASVGYRQRNPAFVTRNDFTPAKEQIERILFDPDLAAYHDAARNLLRVILLRSDRTGMAQQLEQYLIATTRADRLAQDVLDYRSTRALASLPMGKWILAMSQKNSLGDDDEDFRKQSQQDLIAWRSERNLPWLAAAMSGNFSDRATIDELIEASRQIDRRSPAYLHLAYHRIRLLSKSGRQAEAARELDGLDFEAMDASTQNQFLSLRLATARNAKEFFTAAPRRVLYFISPKTAPDIQIPPFKRDDDIDGDLYWRAELYHPKPVYFDEDAMQLFNNCLPLSNLVELMRSQNWPQHLRNQLVVLAFTRAVALERWDIAVSLTGEMAQATPEVRSLLTALRASSDKDRQKFLAALTLLRAPSASISLESSLGYAYPPTELGPLNPRWWFQYQVDQYNPDRQAAANRAECGIPFIDQSMRNVAAIERNQLAGTAPASSLLGRIVLKYGPKHLSDPLLPEALHFTVRATRYGSSDREVSQRAFALLHKRFPNNRWTKQTPFWY